MASRSKDGEIIARWLVRNGYIPVRGSTGKRGGAALQEMIDLVRAGHAAALTIDGPKGPPRQAADRRPQAGPRDGRLDPSLYRREQPPVVREVVGSVPRAEAVLPMRRRLRRALSDSAGDAGPRGADADRRSGRCDHGRGRPRGRRGPAASVGPLTQGLWESLPVSWEREQGATFPLMSVGPRSGPARIRAHARQPEEPQCARDVRLLGRGDPVPARPVERAEEREVRRHRSSPAARQEPLPHLREDLHAHALCLRGRRVTTRAWA